MTASRISTRTVAAVAAIGTGLALAACGGSAVSSATSAASAASSAATSAASGASSAATSAASGASSAATSAASGVSGGATISVAGGPAGSHLTGHNGLAVYLWVADSPGKSNCQAACASVWPPVSAAGKPTAGHGAVASDLGTIKRADGTTQVTYKGHALYYYVNDKHSGQTTGQGSDSFGAKWWLVSPSGTAITSTGSSSSSAAPGY